MPDLTASFAALADPVRFAIVDRLLKEGELSAGEIGQGFKISGPAVSQHLAVLHDTGLVQRRRLAQRRMYSVEPKGLSAISDWVNEARKFWEASLDRLEQALKQEKE
ncbi:MAG: metalloregulator ArsR/SmtB family transcription factor [Paracoccaceae bacterium]|jgi:DNA-binding transcriptional ArsR family regulator|nr:metalloregulator ArsR/SmtB family transcription factor [Paracoccaceae bacterium]